MKRLSGSLLLTVVAVVILCVTVLHARTAFAADVTITRLLPDPVGQRRWEAVGMNGAADKGKCFKYNETNDFGEGNIVTSEVTSAPLGNNGKLILWTAQNTTLGNTGTFVACPGRPAPAPGVPAPGGDGQVNFVPGPGGTFPTLSFGLMSIDSDEFDLGPHGADPLFGGSMSMSSLHVYVGYETDITTSFGADFSDSPVPEFRIIKNAAVLFSAEVLHFKNGPGESEFFAPLTNVQVANTIGSPILSQLSAEYLQGHLLQLHFIPGSGQNLATATRDASAGVDYAVAGGVTGRIGIRSTVPTTLVPASNRVGLVVLAVLLTVIGTATLFIRKSAKSYRLR